MSVDRADRRPRSTPLVAVGLLWVCACSSPATVEARPSGAGECASPSANCVLVRCEVHNSGKIAVDVVVAITMPIPGDDHVIADHIPKRLEPGERAMVTREFTGVEAVPFTCSAR